MFMSKIQFNLKPFFGNHFFLIKEWNYKNIREIRCLNYLFETFISLKKVNRHLYNNNNYL